MEGILTSIMSNNVITPLQLILNQRSKRRTHTPPLEGVQGGAPRASEGVQGGTRAPDEVEGGVGAPEGAQGGATRAPSGVQGVTRAPEGAEGSVQPSQFFSIYRDILFLSLVALGRDNIDVGENSSSSSFVSLYFSFLYCICLFLLHYTCFIICMVSSCVWLCAIIIFDEITKAANDKMATDTLLRIFPTRNSRF